MLATIDELARDIDEAWALASYKPEAFSDIAARCLDRPLGIDFPTLARHLSKGLELPRQRRMDQGFGQPAVTLHHGEGFVIEALCWHTASPAIHQHAFSGAFRVLTGRSFHSRFSFVEEERLPGGIVVGALRLEGVELLDETAIMAIPDGSVLIHAAFHLDNPSMSLIARTHDLAQPEYTYLPPGIAFDPSARSDTLHKRLQLLDTLAQCRHELYAECVATTIDNTDLYEGMQTLMRIGRHGLDEPTYLDLLDRFLGRYGPGAAPLRRALVEDRRRGALVGVRATVADETVRYFLACLLNFSSRAPLVEAMVAHAGSVEEAHRQIAVGVRTVLHLGCNAAAVVDAGSEAMLDDIALESFTDWVKQRWGRTLDPREDELMVQFYGQLLQHPLLTPLHPSPPG